MRFLIVGGVLFVTPALACLSPIRIAITTPEFNFWRSTTMKLPLRAVLISTAISLTYSCFVFACPQWTRDLGLDVWNVLDDERLLRNNLSERERLQAISDRLTKRIALKSLIAEEVIERRITLAEAIEQFVALNRIDPDFTKLAQFSFPKASEEEIAERQVMVYLRNHSPSDSAARGLAPR